MTGSVFTWILHIMDIEHVVNIHSQHVLYPKVGIIYGFRNANKYQYRCQLLLFKTVLHCITKLLAHYKLRVNYTPAPLIYLHGKGRGKYTLLSFFLSLRQNTTYSSIQIFRGKNSTNIL